jgi:hypothetical protein
MRHLTSALWRALPNWHHSRLTEIGRQESFADLSAMTGNAALLTVVKCQSKVGLFDAAPPGPT